MRAKAPKGPASQRCCNARGHGPLLQGIAAKAILPPLPKLVVPAQPTEKPHFNEASCIPGEEVSRVIFMAIYTPVHTSI